MSTGTTTTSTATDGRSTGSENEEGKAIDWVRFGDLKLQLVITGPKGETIASFTNPREHTGLEKAAIQELAEDIATRGVQAPLRVRRVIVEGKVHTVIMDGQRRYLALKLLDKKGDTIVPVYDEESEPQEFTTEVAAQMLDDALAIGTHRRELSSYELVQSAVRLRSSGSRTNEQIGGSIGKSGSWVSRMLTAIGKAEPDVVSAWRTGKITDEQFKDLAATEKAQQAPTLTNVVEMRASGDREAIAEARQAAKMNTPAPQPKAKAKAAKQAELAITARNDGKKAKAVAPSPPKPAKPSPARIAEFVELRTTRPSREPYIRGLLDMAAFVVGEITDDDFSPAFRAYQKAVAKAATVTAPPAKKSSKEEPKGDKAKAKAPAKKKGDKAKATTKGKPKK
jgi:ParB/RepB/Spo0J family partition protein